MKVCLLPIRMVIILQSILYYTMHNFCPQNWNSQNSTHYLDGLTYTSQYSIVHELLSLSCLFVRIRGLESDSFSAGENRENRGRRTFGESLVRCDSSLGLWTGVKYLKYKCRDTQRQVRWHNLGNLIDMSVKRGSIRILSYIGVYLKINIIFYLNSSSL